jgi:GT2 family glycosyltransferase
MVKISVIIPIFNAEDMIEKTIIGLNNQSLQKKDFEVVFVDDCGQDESLRIIKRYQSSFPHFCLNRNESNLGTYASYNSGAKNAKGSIFLFLDQDCVPDSNLLNEHLITHSKFCNPSAVIGKFDWHKDIEIRPYLEFFRPNPTTLLIEPQSQQNMEVEQFITGNCSIAAKYFREMGGFDEDYYFGFGDTDFGYRWRKKGYRIVGNINAIVYHLHKLDFPSQLRRKQKIGKQAFLYSQKHPELLHNAGIVNAISKNYMKKFYLGVQEFFYHLGIRQSLDIATDQEIKLAKLLIEHNWDKSNKSCDDETCY